MTKKTMSLFTSIEDQGLSFAQVKTLEGNFSLCTENRHRASPPQVCNQTMWSDSKMHLPASREGHKWSALTPAGALAKLPAVLAHC